jgi:hypothetical protein
MPDLVITRLQRADPAALAVPLTDADRTRLREAALARTRPAQTRPARRRHRAALLTGAGLAVCATAAVAAVLLSGQTGGQVRDDYAEVIRRIPLPAGYVWPGADAPDGADGTPIVYAGRNAALMQATGQAGCAWWDAWLRADARGDAGGRAAALRGRRRVLALTPRHHEGQSEDAGGIDASTVAYERGLLAAGAAGRRAPIVGDQRVNCTGPSAPQRSP